jgi:hypothetical protein
MRRSTRTVSILALGFAAPCWAQDAVRDRAKPTTPPPPTTAGTTAVTPTPTQSPAIRWARTATFHEGGKSSTLWISPIDVAEKSPTAVGAQAVLHADPAARVLTSRPGLRLWRVTDADALRRRLGFLLEVLHDAPTSESRPRVVLGTVCDARGSSSSGKRRGLSQAECFVDFWTPGTLR